jgi:hypothetical protein
MTPQEILLALVIGTFGAFAVTLMAATIWTGMKDR